MRNGLVTSVVLLFTLSHIQQFINPFCVQTQRFHLPVIVVVLHGLNQQISCHLHSQYIVKDALTAAPGSLPQFHRQLQTNPSLTVCIAAHTYTPTQSSGYLKEPSLDTDTLQLVR